MEGHLNSVHRISSVVVLTSILIYGVFQFWMFKFYSKIIAKAFFLFDIDIISIFHEFYTRVNPKGNWFDHKIGLTIYYPTYFLLHVLFIYFLFNKEVKVRNLLIGGLTILVTILILLIALSRVYDNDLMHTISRNLFKSLFGWPFILLAIEGGRIMYKDFIRRVEESKKN